MIYFVNTGRIGLFVSTTGAFVYLDNSAQSILSSVVAKYFAQTKWTGVDNAFTSQDKDKEV